MAGMVLPHDVVLGLRQEEGQSHEGQEQQGHGGPRDPRRARSRPRVARHVPKDTSPPAARLPVMRPIPKLPDRIAGITVPVDDVSVATWRWAHRSLPGYLLAHSVRSYVWGAAIADRGGIAFDRQILWTASLMHDVGLTRIRQNTMCFEVEGGEIARRFLERTGLSPERADTVAVVILLHMQPGVTLDDGPEALLLDRSTSLDVRGEGYDLVDGIRADVMRSFPRGAFDRHFLAAIEREVAVRTDCQSARLLQVSGLAAQQATSPWARNHPTGD